MKISTVPSHGLLFLLDGTGTILCATGTVEPYDGGVIGLPIWHCIEDQREADACQAGILRCIRDAAPQRFDAELREIGRWRVWLYPCRAGKARVIGTVRPIPKALLQLTDRERQVCKLLADGHGSKRIAGRLRVTRSTIDNHRSKIARKLGIEAAALVAWCGHHAEWF